MRKMPNGVSGPGALGKCFGLWRSRAIVDAMTNTHRDLKDVCYGWCEIVPLGDFRGGDVCLPGLGYKVSLPVDMIFGCFILRLTNLNCRVSNLSEITHRSALYWVLDRPSVQYSPFQSPVGRERAWPRKRERVSKSFTMEVSERD